MLLQREFGWNSRLAGKHWIFEYFLGCFQKYTTLESSHATTQHRWKTSDFYFKIFHFHCHPIHMRVESSERLNLWDCGRENKQIIGDSNFRLIKVGRQFNFEFETNNWDWNEAWKWWHMKILSSWKFDVVMGNATTIRRMFIASNFILSIFYVNRENEFKGQRTQQKFFTVCMQLELRKIFQWGMKLFFFWKLELESRTTCRYKYEI